MYCLVKWKKKNKFSFILVVSFSFIFSSVVKFVCCVECKPVPFKNKQLSLFQFFCCVEFIQ